MLVSPTSCGVHVERLVSCWRVNGKPNTILLLSSKRLEIFGTATVSPDEHVSPNDPSKQRRGAARQTLNLNHGQVAAGAAEAKPLTNFPLPTLGIIFSRASIFYRGAFFARRLGGRQRLLNLFPKASRMTGKGRL